VLSARDAAAAAFKSVSGQAQTLAGHLQTTSKEGANAGTALEHAGTGAEHAGKGAEGAEGRFAGLKEQLGGVSKIALGMVAGGVLLGLTKGLDEQFADAIGGATAFGASVYTLQTRMGGTAEEASTLVVAMQDLGIPVDLGTQAFTKFAKGLDGVKIDAKGVVTGGLKPTTDAMKDIGVAIDGTDGKVRPFADLMGDVANKFKEMPDGIEKTALAQQLFGKTGASLIPLLDLGKEGLAEITAESKKYGLQLTAGNVADIRKFALAHNEMNMAVEGARLQIGVLLIPVLTRLVGWMTNAIAAVVPFVEHLVKLADIGDKVSAVFQAIKPYLVELKDQVTAFAATALPGIIKAFGDLAPAGQNIQDIFKTLKGLFGDLLAPVISIVSQFTGLSGGMNTGKSAGDALSAALKALVAVVNALSAAELAVAKFIADHKDVQEALTVVIVAATVAWALSTAAAIAHGIATAATTLATNAMTAAQAALNLVMDANPIGLVIIAIAALAAGFVFAYQNSETFRVIVQKAMANAGAAFNDLGTIASTVFGAIKSTLDGVMSAAQGLANFLGSIHAPSISMPNISIPGRAAGGSVAANTTYMVGEHGPELFSSRSPGTIVPNGALATGGGGRTVVVNLTVSGNTMLANDSQSARQLASILRPELNRLVTLGV